MARGSQMGASKYEFNPQQFDIDMADHQRKYKERKMQYEKQLRKLIESEPHRMGENYSLVIEVLREIREDYK